MTKDLGVVKRHNVKVKGEKNQYYCRQNSRCAALPSILKIVKRHQVKLSNVTV